MVPMPWLDAEYAKADEAFHSERSSGETCPGTFMNFLPPIKNYNTGHDEDGPRELYDCIPGKFNKES